MLWISFQHKFYLFIILSLTSATSPVLECTQEKFNSSLSFALVESFSRSYDMHVVVVSAKTAREGKMRRKMEVHDEETSCNVSANSRVLNFKETLRTEELCSSSKKTEEKREKLKKISSAGRSRKTFHHSEEEKTCTSETPG